MVATRTGSIIETRLKEYPVENVKGSLGFRVFGSSTETAFNYYFKSGFTGMNPVYLLSEVGDSFVVLEDPEKNLTKRVSLSSQDLSLIHI